MRMASPRKQDEVSQASHPSAREVEAGGAGFKVLFSYRVSSRTAWATGDPAARKPFFQVLDRPLQLTAHLVVNDARIILSF